MAGEDSQIRRRRTANLDETTVGQLLDLVIEDYIANGQKSLKHARGLVPATTWSLARHCETLHRIPQPPLRRAVREKDIELLP